ncbi:MULTISPECIES: helix-turn-helix domain-containing protein [Planktothricoides]|uniref:Helix-turn-helix transcriptional regulator n=1 Tax=Planktothricoides raciborskii FACHB-1370 TaxID=2949576 RepID=A0ABR8EEX3_9CYAN|nr:helix-turn-helix transcriptional regulator [Planktothricoides raciborskii]MBD2544156.1 helix-turn-helix transcriptional regulator [Planktothricoides raciborskii FACHB-1370]MBD2582642.1 helix-turn-helix transcriptional regulator [Planktothricoides raciborskii FACHB-1261]
MNTSLTSKTLIQWRLRELMARHKIQVNQLADWLQCSRTTASRLKNCDRMPSNLDEEKLSIICKHLNCQPGDLLRWTPDNDAA